LVELLGGEIGVMMSGERTFAGGWARIDLLVLAASHVPTTVMRSPSRQATAAPVASQRSSLCRVLVAEDNPVNQMVIRAMLQKIGIEPTLVADGRQAVDAIAANPFESGSHGLPDAVMDGFEATRIIRDGSESRPVIVCGDRKCDGRRRRTMPRRGHGRLHQQADQCSRITARPVALAGRGLLLGKAPNSTPRHSEGVGAQ
jgi:CheY-like chemotaxis protein